MIMSNIIYSNARASALYKNLLKTERYTRMLECDNSSDVVKVLAEVGFGEGATIDNLDFENLFYIEQERLNSFIKECCPTKELKFFLLAKNDFINAQAFIRAKYLKIDADKMICNDGLIRKEELRELIAVDEYKNLPTELGKTLLTCDELFVNGKATGELIDSIFSSGYYRYIKKEVKNDNALTKIVELQIDGANISTALRSRNFSVASKFFIDGGKISLQDFKVLCESSFESIRESFKTCKQNFLVLSAVEDAQNNEPLRDFERLVDSYALTEFKKNRYETSGYAPFVLYCLYKKADITNVRIILSAVKNNLDKAQVKSILRDSYDG